MKKSKNILIRVIFILTLLSCFGLKVYSAYNSDLYETPVSAGMDSADSDFNVNIDSLALCPNTHYFHFVPVTELFLQTPVMKDVLFISQFSTSIWQPPKIS